MSECRRERRFLVSRNLLKLVGERIMAFGTRYSLKAIAIVTIAGVMGVVAALLGLIAEKKRITVRLINYTSLF